MITLFVCRVRSGMCLEDGKVRSEHGACGAEQVLGRRGGGELIESLAARAS